MISSEPYVIFDNISLETKPIIKIGTFNINDDPESVAKGLVEMGVKCLKFIEENEVFTTFRVEITPINKQKVEWEYNLQVQTTVWFEHLCQTINKNDAIKTARNYVNSVRDSYFPPPPQRKSVKAPIPSNRYCTHHSDCQSEYWGSDQNWRNRSNTSINTTRRNIQTKKYKIHCPSDVEPPIIFCAKGVPQINRFCNWYAENERIVLENDGWIVLSQQDDVREVLVCPHPAKGYENKHIPNDFQQINHKNNKDLIKDLEFWNWVLGYFLKVYLKTICENSSEECPIDLLALNFGIWEAVEAKDKQAKECHGHLHVHLTRSAINQFENKGVDAMFGKIGQPKQYSIQNCEELESKYLLSLEISMLQQNVGMLQQDVSNIQRNVNNIQQVQQDMNAKIDLILKRLN